MRKIVTLVIVINIQCDKRGSVIGFLCPKICCDKTRLDQSNIGCMHALLFQTRRPRSFIFDFTRTLQKKSPESEEPLSSSEISDGKQLLAKYLGQTLLRRKERSDGNGECDKAGIRDLHFQSV